MDAKTWKIIRIGSASLLVGVGVYIVIHKIMVKKKYQQIMDRINKGDALEVATAAVLNRAFSPTYYKNTYTIASPGNTSEALIDPVAGKVIITKYIAQQWADAFYNDYNTLMPNDIDDVLRRIAAIGSLRKMSYVSSLFQQKYGVPMSEFFSKQLLQSKVPNTVAKIQQVIPAIVALPV